MSGIISTDTLARLNTDAGFHWFKADTKRYFASRIAATAYLNADGSKAYFVSSEQFRSFRGEHGRRAYSVRVCTLASGDVDTVGEFQQYATRGTADRAARKAAQS